MSSTLVNDKPAPLVGEEGVPPPEVRIHMTSFGPFLNVKENPSAKIARRVGEMFQQLTKGTERRTNDDAEASASASGESEIVTPTFPFHLESNKELEVSLAGVDAYFAAATSAAASEEETTTDDETKRETSGDTDAIHLHIHLGVYRGLKDTIRLEQVAHNEAHFPSGDFNGVIKDHEPIESEPHGQPLLDTTSSSDGEEEMGESTPSPPQQQPSRDGKGDKGEVLDTSVAYMDDHPTSRLCKFQRWTTLPLQEFFSSYDTQLGGMGSRSGSGTIGNTNGPSHAQSSWLGETGFPAALRRCFQLTADAGRYLCNYSFYKSCVMTSCLNVKGATAPRHHSLFIHVADGDGLLSIEDQSNAVFCFLAGLSAFLKDKAQKEDTLQQEEEDEGAA